MRHSMRRASNNARKRRLPANEAAVCCQRALDLLKRRMSLREIMTLIGISNGTLTLLKSAHSRKDMATLHVLLNPSHYAPGCQRNLSPFAEKVIINRMLYAAGQVFAVDKEGLLRVAALVAKEQG